MGSHTNKSLIVAAHAGADRLDRLAAASDRGRDRSFIQVFLGALSVELDDDTWDSCIRTASDVMREVRRHAG